MENVFLGRRNSIGLLRSFQRGFTYRDNPLMPDCDPFPWIFFRELLVVLNQPVEIGILWQCSLPRRILGPGQ